MMRDADNGVHDEALRQVARRLGAEAAERLDVEQTAQAVLARLRAGDAPARVPIRWMQPAWLRAAAGVVLVVGVGLLVRHRLITPVALPPDAVAPQVSSELTGLSPTQLQEMITGLNDPVEVGPVHAGEAGVEDLSESQLQSLLKAMETED